MRVQERNTSTFGYAQPQVFRLETRDSLSANIGPEIAQLRIAIIAPIYNYYPLLIHSLQSQTLSNWELILIHDGPNATGLAEFTRQTQDDRIVYFATDTRHNDWGHTLRALGLEMLRDRADVEFVLVTNADNYYVPDFLRQMVMAFEPEDVAVFCDVIHSHRGWSMLKTDLRKSCIDCGALLVRRRSAVDVGWSSRTFSADWDYVRDLLERHSSDRFRKLPRALFVHN